LKYYLSLKIHIKCIVIKSQNSPLGKYNREKMRYVGNKKKKTSILNKVKDNEIILNNKPSKQFHKIALKIFHI
jgi:hypothetical protein